MIRKHYQILLAGIDFDFSNATVVFGPSDTQASISIDIKDDEILEQIEEFNLTIIIPEVTKTIGINEGAPFSAVGRILNDDGE